MLKLKSTGLSFMKAETGVGNPLQAPIFVGEDGENYLKLSFVEMDITYIGYYRVLSPILHGTVHTMRWYNPPLLSIDVEIVDCFE